MIRSLFALAATALLAACAPLGGALSALPANPAALADRTAIDEQALLAVELAYKAARTAAELAVDAGLLKGADAARVADLDNRAFTALGAARAAYDSANAASFEDALIAARLAAADLLALTGRK